MTTIIDFPRQLWTSRLLLRAADADDLRHLERIYGDEKVTACGGEHPYPPHICEEIHQFWLDMWRRDGCGYFCIAMKGAPGDVIGFAGVVKVQGAHIFNLFYWFASEYWGYGFAREACEACITLAYDVLHAKTIVATTKASNVRSVRLATSLGMRQALPQQGDRANFSMTLADPPVGV